GQWLAYHVLTGAVVATGAGTLAGGARLQRRGLMDVLAIVERCVAVVGGLAMALVVRGLPTDPAGAPWSAGVIVAVSVLAMGLAVLRRREAWAFVAVVGVHWALTLVLWPTYRAALAEHELISIIQLNLLASSLLALIWLGARRSIYGTT